MSNRVRRLFGWVGEGGAIKNLPLDNPSVSATNYTGAIAGGNYSSIESCTVSVGTVSASFVAGGIAGRNGGTVSSCTNSGTLKGSNTDDIANE